MLKCKWFPSISSKNLSNESPLLGLKNRASEGPTFFNKNLIIRARSLWNSLKKVLPNDITCQVKKINLSQKEEMSVCGCMCICVHTLHTRYECFLCWLMKNTWISQHPKPFKIVNDEWARTLWNYLKKVLSKWRKRR